MARPLRIEYPDAWYHIMNRGRRGDMVFRSKHNYSKFIELLIESSEMWNLRVSAYCLMPNHYHLLVQTPDANISRSMRHIDGVYTQYYNRINGFDGPLFRGRYKAIVIDADSYLLQVMRYIHRNPLKAGLCEKLGEYKWSSHKAYLSKAAIWNWLNKDFILSMMGSSQKEQLQIYRRFVSTEDEEIDNIINQSKLPPILGTEQFIEYVKSKIIRTETDDEIPQLRALSPDIDQIKKTVCSHYQIKDQYLLQSKRGVINEPRNVAIYLTRRLRGDSLNQIGKHYGINKYSSVSSVILRTKKLINEDRNLRNRIANLISTINKSQEQT